MPKNKSLLAAAIISLLFTSSLAGCAFSESPPESVPSSTADPTQTGTGGSFALPTGEEGSTLRLILPGESRYKQTDDPAVIQQVTRRIEAEQPQLIPDAEPDLNPLMRLECTGWGRTLLLTESRLTAENPSGAQRSFRVSARLLEDLQALYGGLDADEWYDGATNTITLPSLPAEGTLTITIQGPGGGTRRTSDPALVGEAARLIEGALGERVASCGSVNGTALTLQNEQWGGTITLLGVLQYQPSASRESAFYQAAPSLNEELLAIYEQLPPA